MGYFSLYKWTKTQMKYHRRYMNLLSSGAKITGLFHKLNNNCQNFTYNVRLNHRSAHQRSSYLQFSRIGLTCCMYICFLDYLSCSIPILVITPTTNYYGFIGFQAAEEIWRRSECNVAPNGAAMRTSVLGAYQYNSLEDVKENAIKFCKITHADPR